jgi:hypothetical protein
MGQRRVQLGRHGDDAHAGRLEIRRPLERIFERRPLDRRVPFDQDELGIEPVLAALCDEAVDEMLHPALQIAAVVVVSRHRDHAEVGHPLSGRFSLTHRQHYGRIPSRRCLARPYAAEPSRPRRTGLGRRNEDSNNLPPSKSEQDLACTAPSARCRRGENPASRSSPDRCRGAGELGQAQRKSAAPLWR